MGCAGQTGPTGQAAALSGWGTQGVHTPYIRDPRTDGAGKMVKGAGRQQKAVVWRITMGLARNF